MSSIALLRRGGLAFVALCTLPLAVVAQSATVTGHVRAETGGPLAGVTVSIAGIGAGSVTGADGLYSFTVPASRVSGQLATIEGRRLGFTLHTAQITLSPGTITHDFVMSATALQLEQVIVTGAGTSQVRERVGSVINTVDSTALQRATQPQNVISALSATTPNVRVNTQSGEPGGSAFVLIRGATSVTGTNQPLIVVDNQPIDNQTISTSGVPPSPVTVPVIVAPCAIKRAGTTQHARMMSRRFHEDRSCMRTLLTICSGPRANATAADT